MKKLIAIIILLFVIAYQFCKDEKLNSITKNVNNVKLVND